jgi:hypothetical protein
MFSPNPLSSINYWIFTIGHDAHLCDMPRATSLFSAFSQFQSVPQIKHSQTWKQCLHPFGQHFFKTPQQPTHLLTASSNHHLLVFYHGCQPFQLFQRLCHMVYSRNLPCETIIHSQTQNTYLYLSHHVLKNTSHFSHLFTSMVRYYGNTLTVLVYPYPIL